MDRFNSPVAPFTLLLPETIPVCEIGEPIVSITAGFSCARPVPSRKHPSASTRPWRRKNRKRAAAQKKHRHKTTHRHNPFPVSSEPIRRRHWQRWSCFHQLWRKVIGVEALKVSAAAAVPRWQKRKSQPRPLRHFPATRGARSYPKYRLRCDDN